MFNLEQAITEWRGQMLSAGVTAPVPLDELESHLRDELAEQIQTGVCDERAFALAVQRLGPATQLWREFAKARSRTLKRKLMLATALALAGMILLFSGFTFHEMEMPPAAQLLAFAPIIVLLLAGWGWRYAVPYLPLFHSQRARLAIGMLTTFFGIGCTALLTNMIVPRFAAVSEQAAMIAVLWFSLPSMLFPCAAIGLMLSEADRKLYRM